jgi:rubrerythrin
MQQQDNPMMQKATSTATPDPHYDLVSVLYHALEGAQTYARYAEDAGQHGDKELAQFFIRVQQEENNRAEQAKQLLVKRLGRA